jgi:hypothetical protein
MQVEVNDIFETVNQKVPFDLRILLNEKNGQYSLPSLYIEHEKERHELVYEFKKEPRMIHMPRFVSMKQDFGKLLIVGKHISENVKTALREADINYVDAAGNTYLNLPPVYVFLDGQKADLKERDEKNRAFTKAGLKLVFAFLERPELLNEPYRTIASETGVVLNTISKVISGLKGAGYIIATASKSMQLINTNALFERWIQEYELRLKPDLIIGRFRFAKSEDFYNWKNLKINIPSTQWGGEPAADLLTNYLNPEILTIYTEEGKIALMKHFKLLPDPAGNVVLCSKFWKQNNLKANVSEALVYADLLIQGDSRNLEVAKRIYEQYLQSRFS